jgi:hypothetical protein
MPAKRSANGDLSMTVVWILIGIGIAGLLAKRAGWLRERGGQSDLGVVSDQWLAEHRLSSQISDPQR